MTTIRLSSEGVWYHDGVEVTHERTVDLFFKSLICRDGRYYLTGEREPLLVDIDDTAYFIRGLNKDRDGYVVTVSDGTREPLALSSLDTGTENQLYCQIKDRSHRAKFERKVYYELMKALGERDGYYGLTVSGIFYPIKAKETSSETSEKQPQILKNKKEKVEKIRMKVVRVKAGKVTPVKNKTNKKIIKKSVNKNVRATHRKSRPKKRR